ncbi:MAG: fumarate hydratase [Planctomycetes bacterium]|nr:fumarate hydratase [Planctomycetota bacterium]
MRAIAFETVARAVEALAVQCAYELPDDVRGAIESALRDETHDRARRILEQLLENARIAAEDRIPLCQDTGLAIVFVELGSRVQVTPPADNPDATLIDAINHGVSSGYENGLLRKSVVAEPLRDRVNTKTNTPAIVHLSIVPGDTLNITFMAKGGGCENKSLFKMFNPTESRDSVAAWIVDVVKNAGPNACPPYVVGVGLGGNFELSAILSKKALLRPVGTRHADPYYADMERSLLNAVNATGIGPQGLGGTATALDVAVETAPCHIASLPVAVTIECHSHRHGRITL